MPEIRFSSGNSVLFEGPGELQILEDGIRIRFDSEASRQTWEIRPDSIDILSETEMEVRMQLTGHDICPVTIDSPWGRIETTAAVHGLLIEEDRAEVVYELEGDRHHFLLEWTKE